MADSDIYHVGRNEWIYKSIFVHIRIGGWYIAAHNNSIFGTLLPCIMSLELLSEEEVCFFPRVFSKKRALCVSISEKVRVNTQRPLLFQSFPCQLSGQQSVRFHDSKVKFLFFVLCGAHFQWFAN